MKEPSNKFLAILLIVSMAVAVFGAFTSLSMIKELTGFGTQGYVNVTIANMSSLNVTTTDCNFGVGAITATQTYAILASNGTILNWNSTGTNTNMTLRNDGNQNLSINVTSGKTLAAFLGGGSNTEYRMWASVKDAGACTNGTILFATCGTPYPCWPGTNMTTASVMVCNNLSTPDTVDEISVGCYIRISDNTPAGSKTDTWTFTGTAL